MRMGVGNCGRDMAGGEWRAVNGVQIMADMT